MKNGTGNIMTIGEDGECVSLYDVISTPEFEEFLELKGELDRVIFGEYNYFQKLQALAKWYKKYDRTPDIDWVHVLTPIEFHAYCLIQCYALPFKPQYPVLNYHLDFAYSEQRLAIELDGKDYHDKEKDAVRDARLREIGWTVIRIPGKEIYRVIELHEGIDWNDPTDDDYHLIKEHYQKTGEGIIRAIRHIKFGEYTDDQGWLINIHHDAMKMHQLFIKK